MSDRDPLDEIRGLLEKTKKQEIDPELTDRLVKNSTISSEKLLLHYTADSPRIFHTTTKDIYGAHDAVHTKLSDGFKKAMPIMMIMIVAMAGVVGVSQMPMIIDSVARTQQAEALNQAKIDALASPEPSTEVRIVYLTPEEAAAQGIAVEDAPPGIDPDVFDRGDEAPLVEPKSELNPVPEEVKLTPEDVNNNQRTEGFDIAGNLIPNPIPFNSGNSIKNQKSCDLENGYSRYWVESRLVPDEWEDKITDRSSQWVCLNVSGYNDQIRGLEINATDIGKYEVQQ
jgi:hypothetical protein